MVHRSVEPHLAFTGPTSAAASAPTGVSMNFSDRPPSTTWEQVPLPDEPESFVWVWFKPGGAPHMLCIQAPEEFLRDRGSRPPITLRRVLPAVGVDPSWVGMFAIAGTSYDGQQGMNPSFDAPLPFPAAGVDPTIGVSLYASPTRAAMPVPYIPPDGSAIFGDIFSRMDATWNSATQIEAQLVGIAKQLSSMLGRINGLNRDLTFDEMQAGDQNDKREWQEARRWLRDIANRLSRAMKDHHIGMTSAAGKRNQYETLYKEFIQPRRQFEGIEQAERELDQFRKSLQTLLGSMTAAYSTAAQDGERRAQQILARIAAKIRSSRSKR
jgi:hypothetical protein